MTLRPATTWVDVWRLWRWRNHPTTRAMMRQTAPIGLREHWRWFQQRRDRRALPYIAEVDGMPVGSGRLDVLGDGAELDVIVAPWARGHGYATQIVAALVREATRQGVARCLAEVLPSNHASRVAFTHNGFELVVGHRSRHLFDILERRC